MLVFIPRRLCPIHGITCGSGMGVRTWTVAHQKRLKNGFTLFGKQILFTQKDLINGWKGKQKLVKSRDELDLVV